MSDNSKLDQITAMAKRALDILFVTNPKGTSLGIFSGITIHGFVGLFEAKLNSLLQINMSVLKQWHYITMGIVAFNLPDFLKRNKIDPKIEEAFTYIRRQVELGTVNRWQAQQMYVNLHAKVLSSIVLNDKTENSRRKLEETLAKGINLD